MVCGVTIIPVVGGCIEISHHIYGVLTLMQCCAYVCNSCLIMVNVNINQRELVSVIVFVSCMDDLDVSSDLFVSVKKVYIFVYINANSFICVHEV